MGLPDLDEPLRHKFDAKNLSVLPGESIVGSES
jgi:hypothetical protein